MRSVVLLFLSLPAFGAWALSPTNGAGHCADFNTYPNTINWTATTTAGSTLFFVASFSSTSSDWSAANAVSSGGVNYVRRSHAVDPTYGQGTELWELDNAAPQTGVTFNPTLPPPGLTVCIYEFTGGATSAFDVQSSNTTTSCTGTDCESTGSMTTTVNGDLIIAIFDDFSTSFPTPGTGFTQLDLNTGSLFAQFMTEYKIQTTAGAIAATATGSGTLNYSASGAAFKVAAGATTVRHRKKGPF